VCVSPCRAHIVNVLFKNRSDLFWYILLSLSNSQQIRSCQLSFIMYLGFYTEQDLSITLLPLPRICDYLQLIGWIELSLWFYREQQLVSVLKINCFAVILNLSCSCGSLTDVANCMRNSWNFLRRTAPRGWRWWFVNLKKTCKYLLLLLGFS